MAVVEYADAIKTVSGALTKINKKSPHAKDQKMVLATHRKAPSQSPDCSRIFFRGLSAVTRTTQPSAHEQEIRLRFAAVSAAVKARSENLSTLSADQAAFMAQKDLPNGKKTFRAYLWMVEGATYDSTHNG